MKKILKIGNKVYAQSIQRFHSSYLKGFPQREQFLLKYCRNIKFTFFKHKEIQNLEDAVYQREELFKFLQNHNFDYLLIDNPLSMLIVSRKISVPIVFDCIDWYDEMYLKELGVDKRYYLLRYGLLEILERAKKVVAQSPVILESLKKWGLKTKQVRIIPNGYDKSLFFPFSRAKITNIKEKLARRFNVDLVNKTIVVYTGKLGVWYNKIKLIAEAITNDQIFFIIGDGPLKNQIKDAPNIIKCGRIDLSEIPNYTNIADVLVFPVDDDCSPIAISEYLAVGKPIVMGKGRIEWLLKDGKTGYLVDNNLFSWKEAIKKAARNKERFVKYNLSLAKKLSWQYLSKKFSEFINL